MTETTFRTATETPTIRVVCDLGPARPIGDVASALADLTTTMGCLYRFRALFRETRTAVEPLVEWADDLDANAAEEARRSAMTKVFQAFHDVNERQWAVAVGSTFVTSQGAVGGLGVRYLSYRNPMEAWLELAQSAATPGAVVASSAVALPRFTAFVVNVGGFLRDFGAERRIKEARARQEEARAAGAEAQAFVARAVANRIGLGLDEAKSISRLQRLMTETLAELAGTGMNPSANLVEQLVGLEDAATMLRTGSTLTEFEEVTGEEPPAA